MKGCQEKKLKPAPLRQDGGSEQGWSPAEGGGGESWTSCSESWWEGTQPLQWPLLKGKKPLWNSICLPSVLVPWLWPVLQFPWRGIFLLLKCWLEWCEVPGLRGPRHAEVGGYPKPGSTAPAAKLSTLIKGKSHYFFLHFLLRAMSFAGLKHFPLMLSCGSAGNLPADNSGTCASPRVPCSTSLWLHSTLHDKSQEIVM